MKENTHVIEVESVANHDFNWFSFKTQAWGCHFKIKYIFTTSTQPEAHKKDRYNIFWNANDFEASVNSITEFVVRLNIV